NLETQNPEWNKVEPKIRTPYISLCTTCFVPVMLLGLTVALHSSSHIQNHFWKSNSQNYRNYSNASDPRLL
ncbi:MAG TPA: hypothetical protein VFN95_02790, partial [Flavitalea sp.]|nr:hypothetical protein [Flavitalea sp.]